MSSTFQYVGMDRQNPVGLVGDWRMLVFLAPIRKLGNQWLADRNIFKQNNFPICLIPGLAVLNVHVVADVVFTCKHEKESVGFRCYKVAVPSCLEMGGVFPEIGQNEVIGEWQLGWHKVASRMHCSQKKQQCASL